MYGAILGDMIGAPYEFDQGNKTKDFPLFGKRTQFTDDSVMTIAVAEALMGGLDKNDEEIKHTLVAAMQKWGHRYPYVGYGGMFSRWLNERHPKPYGSFGNGSAMRVSAAGWLYHTIEDTRNYARLTAKVTHNHPEGIKGAEAVASAIFLARNGHTKSEIKDYIIREFQYDLSRTCDEIRPAYHHVETCQETVPEAITAFLEGADFEDVIRTAVSLGGDCDTLTCIAGSMAEAFYGVPDNLMKECRKRLPEDLATVLEIFEEKRKERLTKFHDSSLDGNEIITRAIAEYYKNSNKDSLAAVLDAIRKRIHENGHFLIPVYTEEGNETSFVFRSIRTKDGKLWNVVFTSQDEYEKGESSQILSNFMDTTMKACLNTEAAGYIINPWGQSFMLTKELIEILFQAEKRC